MGKENLKKIIIIDTDVTVRKNRNRSSLKKIKILQIVFRMRVKYNTPYTGDSLIKAHLPKSFILYMTKDIVSGDFYWFTHFLKIAVLLPPWIVPDMEYLALL